MRWRRTNIEAQTKGAECTLILSMRTERTASVDDVSPTLARRMLLSALRRLHEQDGRNTDQVGAALGVDGSTVARWLNGQKQRLTAHDVRGLCAEYRADEETTAQLIKMAQDARSRGMTQRLSWFSNYEFGSFLDLERDASKVVTVQTTVIPGLLQTERYAHVVIRAGAPASALTDDDVTERVKLRIERQRILQRARPAELLALLDEAVLRRGIDDKEAWHEQLTHILRVSEWPNVTVRVLPFNAGPHAAGSSGPFVLLSFAGLADVAYAENPVNALYMETREETDRYRAVVQLLEKQSHNPEQSAATIADTIKLL